MKTSDLAAKFCAFELAHARAPSRIDITDADLHDLQLDIIDSGAATYADGARHAAHLPAGAVMLFLGVPVFRAEKTRLS